MFRLQAHIRHVPHEENLVGFFHLGITLVGVYLSAVCLSVYLIPKTRHSGNKVRDHEHDVRLTVVCRYRLQEDGVCRIYSRGKSQQNQRSCGRDGGCINPVLCCSSALYDPLLSQTNVLGHVGQGWHSCLTALSLLTAGWGCPHGSCQHSQVRREVWVCPKRVHCLLLVVWLYGKGPGSIYITTFHWQRDGWDGREGKGKKKGNPQQRSSCWWLLTTAAACEGKSLPIAPVVNQVSLLQPYGSACGWRRVLQCGYHFLRLPCMCHGLMHSLLQCVWSWSTNWAKTKSSCAGLTSVLSWWGSDLRYRSIFTCVRETSCQVNLGQSLRAALKRNYASLA